MKLTWRRKRWISLIVVVAIIPPAVFIGLSAMSQRPENLGVHHGRLADCPQSPNCVSTQATEASRRMEPLSLEVDAEAARRRLEAIISEMPRSKIIELGDQYLHAEFTSALFRFVDDVEFWIDDQEGLIHFRSASRSGHADFGVNRRRMEAICLEFSRP